MAGEDQGPVIRPPATLPRQPAEPIEPVLAQRVVGPLRGILDRVGYPVGHPRVGRGVVEVRDRDVGVALDHERAPVVQPAQGVDDLAGLRAVEHEVARDQDHVRPRPRHIGEDGLERDGIAVDVREGGDPAHRRTPSGGMMKLMVVWQATSPSTVATPRPRPNFDPSFSMVTSSRRVSPGVTIRLKRVSSIPANRPIRSPNPGCLATYTAMVWASASTWRTPGITGSPGKWPAKNHSVAVTALSPTMRWADGSYSTIRSTSRNGWRCGIRRSISRVVWTVPGAARASREAVVGGVSAVVAMSVTKGSSGVGMGPSLAVPVSGVRRDVCRYASPGPIVRAQPTRAAAARKAALPTRSSRFVVIRPSRNVSDASSAWWMAMLVTSPSMTSSSRATRPRAIAVSRSGPQTMSLPRSES